jgi:hypothetical protein
LLILFPAGSPQSSAAVPSHTTGPIRSPRLLLRSPRRTHEEIALDLDIDANLVKWRLHQMRKVYRQRLVKLGLASNVTPLHLLVCEPGAIDRLRAAS